MYLVLACPRCRLARVVAQGQKSTSCGSCGRALRLADLRAQAEAATLDEAQEAAGRVNARLAGRERELDAALVPSAPAETRHDDPYDAAAAATRRASSEKDRVDALARALSVGLGRFTRDDLREAFSRASLPERKLDAHLERMLKTDVLFEPSAGCYQAL